MDGRTHEKSVPLDGIISLPYFTIVLINSSVEYQGENDSLSQIFGALADPTRRSILQALSEGEATVNELAQPFAMTLPAVSRHLKVLEKAGLISRGREAQTRPCRLEASSLKTATDWLEACRQTWEGRFERLDEFLTVLQNQKNDQSLKIQGD